MRSRRRLRLALRLVPLALLVTLALVKWELITRAARDVARLEPVVLLVVPLYLSWNVVAANGWRKLLLAASRSGGVPSAWRLSVLRIQAQAVNLTVPLTGLGGEALRASLAAPHAEDVPACATATALDNVAITVAGVTSGALWVWARFGVTRLSAHPSELALVAGVSLLGCGALASLPFALAPVVLRRLGAESRIGRALEPLVERSRALKRALLSALGWHVLERCLCVGEIYLAIHALGLSATLADAAFLSAVLIGISFALFMLPGQLGAAEVGLVAACSLIGVSASAAVAIAFVRRARQLLTTGAGLLSLSFEEPLWLHERGRRARHDGESEP